MKILFWSPNTDIWVHSFPEAIVAESLRKAGHDLLFAHCDGLFSNYCPAMSASGMSQQTKIEERLVVCKRCKDSQLLLKERFSRKIVSIDELLKQENNSELESIILKSKREEILKFEKDGIYIGSIALYDILLQYKKNDLEFSDQEWNSYLISFRNTYNAYKSIKKIFEIFNPDRIVMYITTYSVNNVVRAYAETKNVPTYFLHAGENVAYRLNEIMVGKDFPMFHRKHLIKNWEKYNNKPISKEQIEKIVNYASALIKSKHFLVYSMKSNESVNLIDFFKIPKNIKKVVTVIMSSPDERFAAESVGIIEKEEQEVFKTQADWIKSLIEYFTKFPEFYLIIRVHPRESPNRRDNVFSQNLSQMRKYFTDLPENIKINWPEDKISVYDLSKITDLFLNAWSSGGEELVVLGKPVLIYSDKLLFYPSEINYLAKNEAEYFELIGKLLKEPFNKDKLIKAFRWYNLKLNESVFNVGDNLVRYEDPTHEIIGRSWNFNTVFAYLKLFFKLGKSRFKLLQKEYNEKFLDLIYETPKFDRRISDLIVRKADSKIDLEEGTFSNRDAAEEEAEIYRQMNPILKEAGLNELSSPADSK